MIWWRGPFLLENCALLLKGCRYLIKDSWVITRVEGTTTTLDILTSATLGREAGLTTKASPHVYLLIPPPWIKRGAPWAVCGGSRSLEWRSTDVQIFGS